jgi:hypothetical protein
MVASQLVELPTVVKSLTLECVVVVFGLVITPNFIIMGKNLGELLAALDQFLLVITAVRTCIRVPLTPGVPEVVVFNLSFLALLMGLKLSALYLVIIQAIRLEMVALCILLHAQV